ncbi:hypothetical protein [Pseudoxanthomonas sp.]|uniref:hypothetical protein n=1 Tax=Pseudoxanthomonas sp. TaxID=1871049 RepID=UPI0026298BD3|nr:hypothetical protein [Pseudoxanthomonas sp.]WDS37811.1 MAG: hypothetical protein O8I58_08065 [Pseudoxanthomonas sp.]
MGLFNKIRVAGTDSGSSVLKLLRTMPKNVCASRAFICRAADGSLQEAVGGSCRLNCEMEDGAYRIEVARGGGMDFFIPYGHGAARYCDVPRGAPDGTLVVTFPMNGCALEVQAKGRVNRFFHDADGNSMTGDRHAKCRIEADTYEGPGAKAAGKFSDLPSAMDTIDGVIGTNFEHTIICVKKGDLWNIYQTAVVVTRAISGGEMVGSPSYRHVSNGPPVHIGVFAD